MANIGLCPHSHELINKNDEWNKFKNDSKYDEYLSIYIKDGRSSKAYTKLKELSAEYWDKMLTKYGKITINLGPEDFYSSPYCKECLLEAIKEIDNYDNIK